MKEDSQKEESGKFISFCGVFQRTNLKLYRKENIMKRFLTVISVSILCLAIGANFVGGAEKKKPVTLTIGIPSGYMGNNLYLDKTVEQLFKEGDEWVNWKARLGLKIFLDTHPNIKIDWEASKAWQQRHSVQKKEAILTALAAGEKVPFYLVGISGAFGDISTLMRLGYAADITEAAKKWKWYNWMKENQWAYWSQAWTGGRCYGMPYAKSLFGMPYRMDWFKEAGIFDKEGNPGPPMNWTVIDFRNICLKLRDPKKKRWGSCIGTRNKFVALVMRNFGAPLVIPDPSGKQTWKSGYATKPAIEALEWYRKIALDDSCLLDYGGKEIGSYACIEGGRIAITFASSLHVSSLAVNSMPEFYGKDYNPISGTDKAYYEVVGVRPFIAGPQGIAIPWGESLFYVFNPLLNKEELEAAVEYYSYWACGGKGTELSLAIDKVRTGVALRGEGTCPYPIPGTKSYLDLAPKRFRETEKYAWSLPVPPLPGMYNLPIEGLNLRSNEGPLSDIVEAIYSDPEKVDIQKLAEKVADRVNKNILNYKIEGQTVKDYKRYYEALDKFYKENYPEYYKTTFKQLWEEYYKVW